MDLPATLFEGTVIETGSGKANKKPSINLQYLYHIVLKPFQVSKNRTLKAITRIINEVLTQANRRGITSVAIPPIGTGVLKTPIAICAQAIQNGILEFIKDNQGKAISIKDIYIVVYDLENKEEFEIAWKANLSEDKLRRLEKNSEEEEKE